VQQVASNPSKALFSALHQNISCFSSVSGTLYLIGRCA